MFKEQCGNKHETITVVSLLFIKLVIRCHRLALRICVLSTPTTTHIINNVIPTSSKPILEIYHHQKLGPPPVLSIVKACCNNQLNIFPGLDASLILRHLPPSRATAKGHMIRPRSGIQSTRNN